MISQSPVPSGPKRRSVLVAAGAAGLLLAIAEPAAATVRGERVRLCLPGPSGPRRIGTTSLHLVDRSRQDPWTAPAPRELMISLWYPTLSGDAHRRAPWLTSAGASLYLEQAGEDLQTPLDGVVLPMAHAGLGAPVNARGRGNPVVLFSPGHGSMRAMGTALVEDLASRGYVVAAIDHTYDSQFVEFPGGRLELKRDPTGSPEEEIARAAKVRLEDTRFVLGRLAALNAGRNPDAEGRELPNGLQGSMDLSRIGMFGHSLGGATAADIMAEDSRVLAGADLDGTIPGSVADTGLDRPFLLMSNATHGRDNDPSWENFWSHLRGWRRELRLRDSGHQTYTDLSPLGQQLMRALPLPPPVAARLTEWIGTIDAGRAVAAERAYLGAFFDLHLRHRDDHLLSGPSPRYPEIQFVP
ncbi:lipase [Actinomadura sp. NEAU-AAG7]|uniref:alpha/beta hydrolase family protein n=1 Tax=Actinomadura sp. NEAU-AAG7 TaxID=2839640 RepID=UPI001BE4B5DE|nr:lipase [Actinomadura sp. NEAU-AAG7]MBT2211061.1 lipase [Actinomadura sp. NEAU-AAG7]